MKTYGPKSFKEILEAGGIDDRIRELVTFDPRNILDYAKWQRDACVSEGIKPDLYLSVETDHYPLSNGYGVGAAPMHGATLTLWYGRPEPVYVCTDNHGWKGGKRLLKTRPDYLQILSLEVESKDVDEKEVRFIFNKAERVEDRDFKISSIEEFLKDNFRDADKYLKCCPSIVYPLNIPDGNIYAKLAPNTSRQREKRRYMNQYIEDFVDACQRDEKRMRQFLKEYRFGAENNH